MTCDVTYPHHSHDTGFDGEAGPEWSICPGIEAEDVSTPASTGSVPTSTLRSGSTALLVYPEGDCDEVTILVKALRADHLTVTPKGPIS
jgi:hypothetical protein